MNLAPIQNVYFIGIGGIGMSALARYFNANGKAVCGYDRTPTEITEMLEKEGIAVHFTDDVAAIPASFKDKATTLVVYTPAVPKDHSELLYFQQNGYEVVKRSEVLGFITQNSFCLAVAGTHGKTTTSSILAHILVESGASVSAFLGGIAENFNSNLVLHGNEYTVAEADEFDRSFLRLSPNIACITSMDADHLDIYGDEQHLIEGFHQFAGKIKEGGSLIVRNGLAIAGETFGLEDDSDYSFQHIRIVDGVYHFDFKYKGGNLQRLHFLKTRKTQFIKCFSSCFDGRKGRICPRSLTSSSGNFQRSKKAFFVYHKRKK